ncbi:MAG: Crp/Fnr family transcriptional regulator [Burkholderiales bacterium]
MSDSNLLNYLGHYKEARKFGTGEFVFQRGQPGNVVYIVASGSVEIRIGDTVMEVVGAGGIIGEMSLLDGAPRSATAIAKTACELIEIDERRFLFLISQSPMFALDVMRVMARRLRSTNPAPRRRSLS